MLIGIFHIGKFCF